MSKTCDYCNCPLTILRSPKERRTLCVTCSEPVPEDERPMAPVLRLDVFLQNRGRRGNKG